ncbi:MAG: putative toxin-antitoxin system toxin component, PIN family, partial [Victivallales bacterium]|nr:putative toxin-antitoxin system toxin component, PIN family [Victivallales bacterium]
QMRVVLDTNVLISGIFFGGVPEEIINAWHDGLLQIVTSPQILSEYSDVLNRLSKKHPGIDPEPILALLTTNCECVESPQLADPVCDDPDDDKFFACAVASRVSVIVSGDSHLLTQSGYHDIVVLRPAEIVEQYADLF